MELDRSLKGDPTIKAVSEMLLDVHHRTHNWMSTIFADWLTAVVSSLKRDKDAYKRISGKYDNKCMEIFSSAFGELIKRGLNKDYSDILGPIYINLAGYDKSRMGQYFTPMNVALFMAEATIGDAALPEDRLLKVIEPACGSGAMILAACSVIKSHHGEDALDRVHFTLNDLDMGCSMMAAIQMFIYGVPNWVVTRGNALMPLNAWEVIMGAGKMPDALLISEPERGTEAA